MVGVTLGGRRDPVSYMGVELLAAMPS